VTKPLFPWASERTRYLLISLFTLTLPLSYSGFTYSQLPLAFEAWFQFVTKLKKNSINVVKQSKYARPVPEEFHEVVKLSVDVSANGDRTFHLLVVIGRNLPFSLSLNAPEK
jgi:hypothetical protein